MTVKLGEIYKWCRFWFLILLVFFLPKILRAQYYDSGQDPFKTKWKLIETQSFKLIFPQEIDSSATIYAKYLSKTFKTCGQSLGSCPVSIPILMHNKSSLANGEVAWAPKRMNLITMAPQDNLFIPWYKHLILHESRHVVQIAKINQNFTKVLSYAFGQQIVPAVIGLHVPFWFLEGDAVAYESGASEGGRGMVPDFNMKLKAQVLDKKIYSYPKAMFGSYKHFVPNHYEFGYYIVSSARAKFGTSIWDQALQNVSKYPIHWNPFSASIKKTTGLPERKLYNDLMVDLKEHRDTNINKENNKLQIKNRSTRKYCSYYNPSMYNGKILTIKTSLSRIPRFILIDNEKEKTIKIPGYISNNTFSLSANVLAWNEIKQTRWANLNYSNIVRYDLDEKKLKYLTKKQRVFGSKLSNDARKILSVEVNDSLEWSITIRDAINGELNEVFKMDTLQPVYPNWSQNNQDIVFVGIGDYGRSLGILNIESSNTEWILKNEKIEFSYPQYLGDSILIKGTYQNASNFYSYNLKSKSWTVLSNVRFGVGEGQLINDKLIFSNYTANGFKINELSYTDFINKTIEKPEIYSSYLVDNLVKTEKMIDVANIDTTYNILNYSRLKNLFNVHSWAPLAIRIDNQEFGIGATVMSQNELSTSFLSGGYQYYWAQNRDELFVDYEYKGFYPVISLKYSYSPYYTYDTTAIVNLNWHYLSVGSYVPIVFQKGPWTTRLQPELYYNYDAVLYNPNKYKDKTMHKFSYGLYASNKIMQSNNDLYPRWGQSIYVQYQHAPFDSIGKVMVAQAWLFFPGILNNHSFRLNAGIQKKESGTFSFTDRLVYPRGYFSKKNTEMATASLNYSLPLLYPDLNVFQLAYIKRIKANLFYDYASYYFEKEYNFQESLGFELTADFHAFRFVAPFEIGVRYARKLSDNQDFIQFMIKVDFNDLY